MAYGVITTVKAPIEAYDGVHAAALRRRDELGDIDGLISHVGRRTTDGFQVIEVWESKERYDDFTTKVFPAIVAEVMGAGPPPGEMGVEEFEVRGLVIPGTDSVQ
jgi:hypothetical protein